jgi:hypothetical protein
MIIEDENGRDWTRDELEHHEPEPPFDEDEPSVDLEEIDRLHQTAVNSRGGAQAALASVEATLTLLARIPGLVAELHALRADRELFWNGMRYEFTLTRGNAEPDPDAQTMTGAAQAEIQLAEGEALWSRSIHIGPWVQLSTEPPF